MVDHDKTAGHSIVNITDAVTAQRQVLQQRINASSATRTHIQRSISQVESAVEKLHVCRDAVISDLRSIIRDARKQLDQGEQAISNVILQQYEAQQNTLLDKQLQFQQADDLLDKHIRQSKELVRRGDISEMVNIAEKLAKATETTLITSANFDVGEKYLPTDMITEATALNDSLCDLGEKCFKSFLPTKVLLEDKKFIAGLKSTLSIKFLNDEGNKVPISACFLSIKITDPWNSALPVTLNSNQPECTVTFTPQKSGAHDISVKYCGHQLECQRTHISVESNDPVLKIGGQGHGHGKFNSPRGIAIDTNNCLYVTDTGNGLIQKFSAKGEFLSQFRVNKRNKSYTAFDIALDLNKELIICTSVLIENNAAVKGNKMLQLSVYGKFLGPVSI